MNQEQLNALNNATEDQLKEAMIKLDDHKKEASRLYSELSKNDIGPYQRHELRKEHADIMLTIDLLEETLRRHLSNKNKQSTEISC